MDKDTIEVFKSILKDELNPIKNDITAMKDDLSNVKDDIVAIKSQQDENTQFLRSLIECSEVHKAEIDKVNGRLAHIEGELKSTRARANLALDNAALNRIDISKIKEN